jgi:hypothetical protein
MFQVLAQEEGGREPGADYNRVETLVHDLRPPSLLGTVNPILGEHDHNKKYDTTTNASKIRGCLARPGLLQLNRTDFQNIVALRTLLHTLAEGAVGGQKG